MKVLSSFLFSIYLCVAIPPIPKFACLYIWGPSMCGLGCSKCMFWICYKVIVLVTDATDSLERRKTKTVTCFHIFIFFTMYIWSAWPLCSIVYNNEFSSRLSVGSIMRLRAAAITAMSQDSETDTAMILRLARHFLHVSKYQQNGTEVKDSASDVTSRAITEEKLNDHIYESEYRVNIKGSHFFSFLKLNVCWKRPSWLLLSYHHGCVRVVTQWPKDLHRYSFSIAVCNDEDQDLILWDDADMEDRVIQSDHDEFTNPFSNDVMSNHDPVSQFMVSVPRSESLTSRDPPEMYLPGLVIHIVPQPRSFDMPQCRGCAVQEKTQCHKAYIANRESFKDIIVSPSMFLDHLPWRYQNTVALRLFFLFDF